MLLDLTPPAAPAHSMQLLLNNYMATLNAALRHVAASDSMALLDFEAVALQLPAAHLYMDDGLHPQVLLTAKVLMNLLLNEYYS
jgi:hypothetical protein